MSDQSLRDALAEAHTAIVEIRQFVRAETPNATGTHNELGRVLGIVEQALAAHPAEPAPVVTDEAVEGVMRDIAKWDADCWLPFFPDKPDGGRAAVRHILETAAPLLGPRPLLDQGDVFAALDEVYTNGAMGGEWSSLGADAVMDLARPMPTREQIDKLMRRHTVGAFNPEQSACACDRTWRSHAEYREHVRDALLALLNGAKS